MNTINLPSIRTNGCLPFFLIALPALTLPALFLHPGGLTWVVLESVTSFFRKLLGATSVAFDILREGNLNWDYYKKHLKDDKTLALCRNINVTVDPRDQAELPSNMASFVRVKTNGEFFEKFVPMPKGEPGNLMSQEEIRIKFDGLCQPYLGKEGANKLASTILALEEANSVSSFMALSR